MFNFSDMSRDFSTFCWDYKDSSQKSKVIFVILKHKNYRETAILIDSGGMSYKTGTKYYHLGTYKPIDDCKKCKHGLRLLLGRCKPNLKFMSIT